MLHENKIRCFLSLAETQNFTMTASLLYLSQQAVSKNIVSLEEDLGMKLFTRTSRSVELTPAAGSVTNFSPACPSSTAHGWPPFGRLRPEHPPFGGRSAIFP